MIRVGDEVSVHGLDCRVEAFSRDGSAALVLGPRGYEGVETCWLRPKDEPKRESKPPDRKIGAVMGGAVAHRLAQPEPKVPIGPGDEVSSRPGTRGLVLSVFHDSAWIGDQWSDRDPFTVPIKCLVRVAPAPGIGCGATVQIDPTAPGAPIYGVVQTIDKNGDRYNVEGYREEGHPFSVYRHRHELRRVYPRLSGALRP